MNRSGLLIRLAVVMIFSSLAVGFISAQIFYRLTYLNEVEIANKEIAQLYRTVSSTASIAAYLEDNELANEVVNGLATNGVVHSAKIKANKLTVSSFSQSEEKPLVFDLLSPFEQGKVVGELVIIPDLAYIENRAQAIGQGNAKALIAQSSLVTLISIFIAYILITKPLISIASELHSTSPGTSNRISTPDFHKQSELGVLVRDINHLLSKTEKQITEDRNLRLELEILEKRFRMLFENSASPIVLMEPRGSILLCNDSFNKMLDNINVAFKKSFGPLLEELLDEPGKLQEVVQNSFANDEIATGEYKLNRKRSNQSVWVQVVVTSIVSEDLKEYYQITLHDISKRKKELEQLNKMANYDQLTQLLNRHAAEIRMSEHIANKVSFGLVLIDLNRFKQVNDIYGHESGDEVLIHVSSQLKKGIRRDDFACRWGGDEFVLVLKDANKQGVEIIAKKLESKIKIPFYLAVHDANVSVGVSMGASFYPDDGLDMQDLIRLADQAMYVVKGKGKKSSACIEFSDVAEL